MAIAIAAFDFTAIIVFHWFVLPTPTNNDAKKISVRAIICFYNQTVKFYFSQPKILVVLAFILFYRFGEGMLVKISAPFILDEAAAGGLGLSTSYVELF